MELLGPKNFIKQGGVDWLLSQLPREGIRKRFEERFTARRMAQDYLAVYRSLIDGASSRLRLVVDEAPSLQVAAEGH